MGLFSRDKKEDANPKKILELLKENRINRPDDKFEFLFTETDFQRIRKLIFDYAGISLNDTKKDLVYSRIARRLRNFKMKTFKEYLDFLEKTDSEWEHFGNSLTTNLTSFFREPHHFPILANFLQSRRGKEIKIWCSAASTGEEPYSIAMTVSEALGRDADRVNIIATDLDTNVLAHAEKGVYTADRVTGIDPDRLKKFFLKGSGDSSGQVKVIADLRNMIEFKQLNLLSDKYVIPHDLDIIFCRNVMIYFERDTQYQILKKMAPLLKKNGLLFAGHSESFHHASDLFALKGKTVYELSPNYRGPAEKK